MHDAHLVSVPTPIEVCKRRDPKGVHRQARAGGLSMFTGISDPYEPPDDAEMQVDSARVASDAAAVQVPLSSGLRSARVVP